MIPKIDRRRKFEVEKIKLKSLIINGEINITPIIPI